MPSAAPIILDDASLPLVHAWRQTLLTTPSVALELLAGLAGDAPPQLAQQFYATLMEDPRANRFLDHDQVRNRLQPAMQRWLVQLLYALASPDSLATIEPLAASEFGLWFIHKGIPSFGQNSETEHLSSLITQTDQLLAQLQAGGVAQTANLMPAIRQQLEQIRALQTMLFERIGELDSGSDPLTNLLNRRFLPTVLRREIELTTSNGTRFAVLLIDLDHFKSINDRYGHETGDRALQHVATTLSQHTRGSDYLFRYGGEEFVVVLVGVSALQAMVIAENLLGRIRNAPLKLANDNELVLTASIGVAAFDGHPDYQRLMARADAAMYQAKNGGRDQVQLAP